MRCGATRRRGAGASRRLGVDDDGYTTFSPRREVCSTQVALGPTMLMGAMMMMGRNSLSDHGPRAGEDSSVRRRRGFG
jgi:hypothetical protein